MLVCLVDLMSNSSVQAPDAENTFVTGPNPAGKIFGRRFKSGYPVMLQEHRHSMSWRTGYLAGQFMVEEASLQPSLRRV